MAIDRNLPAAAVGEAAKMMQASGVVDFMMMWDQLTSWIPPCLWNPQNTPLTGVLGDIDSFSDWNVMGAYGVAQAPGLGVSISMDAIRRGPAELTQTMLTMANVTQGKSIYQLGSGEIKQCQPFGWKRSEGISRLEDFYRAFHAFWNSDKPIDFEGNHAKFDQAWLGVAKNYRPRIWGLGGGPRIIDLATSYADGFASSAPVVWSSPEHAAEQIKLMKQQLESKGRDPEKFDFGIWSAVLLHEDEDVIKRALTNPLIAWTTLVMGRIIQSEWLKEGIEPPMPADWHYALKMLPVKIGLDEAMTMLKRVTPQHSERSWFYGTPKQVAGKLQAYIDAGVTWVLPLDMLPMVLEPQDASTSITRSIEVCRILKANNA
jgi:phthiodiolone/phenolphthiodiolone dimycocerosates ketoreductase